MMGYRALAGFPNYKRVQPTSHDLAKLLLAQPDMPLSIDGLGKDIWIREIAVGELPDGAPVFVVEVLDS